MLFSPLNGYKVLEIIKKNHATRKHATRVLLHVEHVETQRQYKQINIKLDNTSPLKWFTTDSENRLVALTSHFPENIDELGKRDEYLYDYLNGLFLIKQQDLSHYIELCDEIKILPLDERRAIVSILQPWFEGSSITALPIGKEHFQNLQTIFDVLHDFHEKELCLLDISPNNILFHNSSHIQKHDFRIIDFEQVGCTAAKAKVVPGIYKAMEDQIDFSVEYSPIFDFRMLLLTLYYTGALPTSIFGRIIQQEISSSYVFVDTWTRLFHEEHTLSLPQKTPTTEDKEDNEELLDENMVETIRDSKIDDSNLDRTQELPEDLDATVLMVPPSILELHYKGKKLRFLETTSPLNSYWAKSFGRLGTDAKYWDQQGQFILERRLDGWYVVPNKEAQNDTILNKKSIVRPMKLREKDILGVGNEEKDILKTPMTIKILPITTK